MLPVKRRQFLQFAGSTLAAIGLNQLDITQQGLRYGHVLAQPTPRKRALLVGINNYPVNLRFTPLQGCITDVELQKELYNASLWVSSSGHSLFNRRYTAKTHARQYPGSIQRLFD